MAKSRPDTTTSVTKVHITTKTGDDGMSGLADGRRISKRSTHFAVIGALDELNSWLGLAVADLPPHFTSLKEQLQQIQDTLFYVGAEIACSPKASLSDDKVLQLERWQTAYEQQLADNWHTRFVLPGGTHTGAHLDVARTVCRRAERELLIHQSVHAADENVSSLISRYLNRLSDFLYIARCYVNQELDYQEKEFIAD